MSKVDLTYSNGDLVTTNELNTIINAINSNYNNIEKINETVGDINTEQINQNEKDISILKTSVESLQNQLDSDTDASAVINAKKMILGNENEDALDKYITWVTSHVTMTDNKNTYLIMSPVTEDDIEGYQIKIDDSVESIKLDNLTYKISNECPTAGAANNNVVYLVQEENGENGIIIYDKWIKITNVTTDSTTQENSYSNTMENIGETQLADAEFSYKITSVNGVDYIITESKVSPEIPYYKGSIMGDLIRSHDIILSTKQSSLNSYNKIGRLDKNGNVIIDDTDDYTASSSFLYQTSNSAEIASRNADATSTYAKSAEAEASAAEASAEQAINIVTRYWMNIGFLTVGTDSSNNIIYTATEPKSIDTDIIFSTVQKRIDDDGLEYQYITFTYGNENFTKSSEINLDGTVTYNGDKKDTKNTITVFYDEDGNLNNIKYNDEKIFTEKTQMTDSNGDKIIIYGDNDEWLVRTLTVTTDNSFVLSADVGMKSLVGQILILMAQMATPTGLNYATNLDIDALIN